MGTERAHVEHRPIPSERLDEFVDAVSSALRTCDGVRGVTVNPWVRRVIVAHPGHEVPLDELAACVEQGERAVGIADTPFPRDGPDHPADLEPVLQEVTQVLSDVAGLGGAVYGRLREMAPGRGPADLSSVLTLLENVPQLRGSIERTLGARTADLLLGVSSSLVRGITLGVTGQVVDMTRRLGGIRHLTAARATWARREPDLHRMEPARFPGPRPDRPTPLPDGPVERYVDRGWSLALGGFAASVVSTEDVERSTAPLLDAVPKAARHGRDAFCRQLARVLARRDCLVLDLRALHALDRVDTVVVEAELLVTSGPGERSLSEEGTRLLQVLRAAPFELVLTATDPSVMVPAVGACVTATEVDDEILARQEEDHVVLAVGATGAASFPRADVRVGLHRPGHPPAWDADVLVRDELADVLLMVRAASAAQRNSAQAVTLNAAGAAIGATTALGGFQRSTARRVLQVADAASLLAMGNGFRLAGNLAHLPDTLERDEPPWHELDVEEVLELVGSSRDGLAADDVADRRQEPRRRPSRLRQAGRAAGEELANPITPVLGGGVGLSLASGSVGDAGLVASVLGLNAVVGGAQRLRAERAIETLRRHERHRVTVVRDGRDLEVDSDDLVVGDMLRLAPGMPVPADARVVESQGLELDESDLTGESMPVAKGAEPVSVAAVADRSSMVHQASRVAAGAGTAVVVATGDDTQARRALAWTDLDATAGSGAGVEARLQQLTRTTVPLALLSAGGVTLSGLVRHTPTRELVDASIGLAIAAVPEGLPLLATAAQRAAAGRLSRYGVLARDPRAIEALGRVDVLCADKTGTLTEGRIHLDVVSDGRSEVPADDASHGAHQHVLLTARRATPIDPGVERLAHPTDEAVAIGTGALGVHREVDGEFEVVDDLPFEPGRGYHAVLADTPEGRLVCVKGAPEQLLRRCTAWRGGDGDLALDEESRARLDVEAERLATSGRRVLAIAERAFDGEALDDADVDDLAFVGFLGLRDPVRPVSRDAIARLRGAGTTVVMITGDHPSTAASIAEQLALDDGELLTGADLDDLDDDALATVLPQATVFARVTPLHKARIVRAYEALGRVVAMTGDGANDAPAMRLADVGIAVGSRATTAARDTAELVITDDRLEVIVDAIAEGRGLWGSVRDGVSVLVGGNLGEISFMLLGSLVGRRPPLNARQLLLVNLLTDVAPAMALASRSPRASVEALLAEGPERSLGRELDHALLWRGIGATTGATAAFTATRWTGSHARARTTGLVGLVGSQLGQTLATSHGDPRVIATGVGSFLGMAAMIQTPGISRLVGCRPMGPVAWLQGTAGAALGTAVGVLGPRVEERLTGRRAGWTSEVVTHLADLAPDIPGLFEPSDDTAPRTAVADLASPPGAG